MTAKKAAMPRNERIALSVTKLMRVELEAEAWEEGRSLSDYIFRLLERRGKLARSVGKAGGYALAAVANPPEIDEDEAAPSADEKVE